MNVCPTKPKPVNFQGRLPLGNIRKARQVYNEVIRFAKETNLISLTKIDQVIIKSARQGDPRVQDPAFLNEVWELSLIQKPLKERLGNIIRSVGTFNQEMVDAIKAFLEQAKIADCGEHAVLARSMCAAKGVKRFEHFIIRLYGREPFRIGPHQFGFSDHEALLINSPKNLDYSNLEVGIKKPEIFGDAVLMDTWSEQFGFAKYLFGEMLRKTELRPKNGERLYSAKISTEEVFKKPKPVRD